MLILQLCSRVGNTGAVLAYLMRDVDPSEWPKPFVKNPRPLFFHTFHASAVSACSTRHGKWYWLAVGLCCAGPCRYFRLWGVMQEFHAGGLGLVRM